jgi:hypothetical protein
MILPIFVAGILMLGILAPTARGADDNAGGGEIAPAAPPPATETPPPVAAPPASASQVSNNTDFVNTVLEMQNRKRAAVGLPPLMWSNTLAAGGPGLGRASGDYQQLGPLAWKLQRLCREHCLAGPFWAYVAYNGPELDQRKEPLSRRPDAGGWGWVGSLRSGGLEDDGRDRLLYGDRQCQ